MTVQVTDSVQADGERAEAAAAVDAAEAQLASGARGVSISALTRLRDKFRHADLSAQGAHQRAERERQAARLSGLGEIGDQVDALAAGGGAELAGAFRALAAAADRVRALAAGWDGTVGMLADAARDLGAEPPAPSGPRKSSSFISVCSGAVVHKRTEVRPVAPHLDQAIVAAVSGDADKAITLTAMVKGLPEPKRADNYFRAPSSGQVIAYDDPLPGGIAVQIANGELVPLSEVEVSRYLAGELG
jgi:hypothetical protein